MWLSLPVLAEDFLLFHFSLSSESINLRNYKDFFLSALCQKSAYTSYSYFLLKVVQGHYSSQADENFPFLCCGMDERRFQAFLCHKCKRKQCFVNEDFAILD